MFWRIHLIYIMSRWDGNSVRKTSNDNEENHGENEGQNTSLTLDQIKIIAHEDKLRAARAFLLGKDDNSDKNMQDGEQSPIDNDVSSVPTQSHQNTKITPPRNDLAPMIDRLSSKVGTRYKTKAPKKCSAEGCTTKAVNGGVCKKHGAKTKQCTAEGCTNQAQNGGVCFKHGAKVKQCSAEGCTNQVKNGGVCIKHGAKVKQCIAEGCTNQVQNGGVCFKHGAKRPAPKQCSAEGCTNQVQNGGVCIKHGAKTYKRKRKECSTEGCTNKAQSGGFCKRHRVA